ncbi:MAG TPA: beta-L-arabinofuranosidase domain-containing protein [Chitinophagaceae bacterium]|nr:beta-L-arabinofuranosidase domain-containing protein [Chitinophagaceae bacterium]
MRNLFRLTVWLCSLLIAFHVEAQKTGYAIRQIPLSSITMDDGFWTPVMARDRTLTQPHVLAECLQQGRLTNFVYAAQGVKGKFCGIYPFDDSDIYKSLEGASYSLMDHPDARLEKFMDSIIAIVAAAQRGDGYLYTPRETGAPNLLNWMGPQRWINERNGSHEFYDAGHLYEAAVAYYQATGKRSLLDVALKNADLIASTFGPEKRKIASGHEEIEIGLIKLYGVTHQSKYLDLAEFLINQRGTIKHPGADPADPYSTGAYSQDDTPVVDQTKAEGHAVRAMYLYSAMTDLVALKRDSGYLKALNLIWKDMVYTKLYITGGIGAVGNWEGFGRDYQLPNRTAYNETCAAVGCILWNERMFRLTGEAKYINVLEKTLYNGLLSGVSLDGDHFFYSNAMEVREDFHHPDLEPARSPWFPCSCCPTNIVRLIPAIPGLVYAQGNGGIYVNLFAGSTASFKLPDHDDVQLIQRTNYPWDGQVKIAVNPRGPRTFPLFIRIPGWLGKHPVDGNLYSFLDSASSPMVLKINGSPARYRMEKGYAVLDRNWEKGDSVELDMPMHIRRVITNDRVVNDRNQVALQRGPIVYCAEWKDNQGRTSNLILPDKAALTADFRPDLLGGVEVITGQVPVLEVDKDGLSLRSVIHPFTAIPYYSWANRGTGEMTVFLPRRVKDVVIVAMKNK